MPTALRHTSRSRSSGDIGIGDGDGARFTSSTANAANTFFLLSDYDDSSAVAAASTCHVRHKWLHGTDAQNLDLDPGSEPEPESDRTERRPRPAGGGSLRPVITLYGTRHVGAI